MPTETITQNTRGERGADAASPIDFAIHLRESLVIFVPLTEGAEEHADRAITGAFTIGGNYIVDWSTAATIVHNLFAEGFRLSLDGREIVPARHAC